MLEPASVGDWGRTRGLKGGGVEVREILEL